MFALSLLPLLFGVAASQLDFSLSGPQCDHFSAVLVLRCVSPLIEYTKQYSRTGPTANPTLICSLYDEYLQCAPERIRHACSGFVGSVESVYDYVCSDSVKANFTRSYACLASAERSRPVQGCENNVTLELKDVALAENTTAAHRMDMQCDAIRTYFRCVKSHFTNNCGEDGWVIKKEVTIRSTASGAANCTNLDNEDPSIPICREDGTCYCKEGYRMKNPELCEDIDECSETFGICSQRCENTAGSFECHCDPEDYVRDVDNNTLCVRRELVEGEGNETEPVSILFAHGQSIWNISMDGEDFQLIRAGLQKAAMIDIDAEERRLYYVDIGANQIQRIRFEGAFPQTIQEIDVDGTEGIAVDWIGRNLYTVRHNDMYVQRLDGPYRKALYKKVFKLPRALIAYPQKGLLYASDWGQQAFIARANTDGTEFKKIITSGLVWPNGLAVDYYADRLYWADAFLDIIECSELDGSGRRTVLKDPAAVPHIFSMIVFDDSLYWTDWTFRGIVRASKYTADNVTVIAHAALLPYGVKLHHKVVQPRTPNPCESMECEQLCLIKPPAETTEIIPFVDQKLEGICTCADGFEGSNSCSIECSEDNFVRCGGKEPSCLSRRYRCDGVENCADGVDEVECPQRVCRTEQWQCHDGNGCIQESQVCDGLQQCTDGSDEKYC